MTVSNGLAAWHKQGQTAEFRGHQIFYQDSCAGEEVILLIHGFPTAGWDWHYIWKALQKLDVPLLLIDGTADPVSGGHMADHYESLIPQPNVVRLNGIGHYPQLEAPRAVLEHFISFIGSNKNI